jgi:hypothetical protein
VAMTDGFQFRGSKQVIGDMLLSFQSLVDFVQTLLILAHE